MVQELADYACIIQAWHLRLLYSERLGSARLLAIIMPPNCPYALIVCASVRILCCSFNTCYRDTKYEWLRGAQ